MRLFEERRERRERSQQAEGTKAPDPSKQRKSVTPTALATTDNNSVVDWVKAGVSEKEILARITQAKVRRFDLSSKGMSDLTASGVSALVVDLMGNSMRGDNTVPRPHRRWGTLVFAYILAYWPYLLML